MKILKLLVATIPAMVFLAACGGGNGEVAPFNGTSGSGTGGGATPAAITLTSDSSGILSNGSTTATITVVAVDSGNVVLPNVQVTLSADSGALSVGQAKTDSTGKVTATLSTGGNPTLRTITVTAKAGSLTKTVQVQVIPAGGVIPVASLTIESSATTIPSDGSKTASITAYARDASNNLLSNVSIVFGATSGGIVATNSVTDASGAARAVLSTAGDSSLRTITVTAKSGSLTASVNVSVTAAPAQLTVQLGSGFGSGFTSGTIAASNPNLSAGGSSSLQVVLQQSDGTLYTQLSTITFSSPCAARGAATLTPSIDTTTGVATATYSASGCSGSDTVTASTTVGTKQLSAQVALAVQPASVGSIIFLSADPEIISLTGISSTGVPATSTVKFQVRDVNNNPRPGATVNFTLSTQVGGVCLQQGTTCGATTTAISDASGNVQAVVVGGTAPTPVRVIATVQDATLPAVISTQSSQLVVTTGIVVQNGFSLAFAPKPPAGCAAVTLPFTEVEPNVEAPVGSQYCAVAFLADRYNNPVPAGTAVTFHTNGGQIEASCTTKYGPVNGVSFCTATWTVTTLRPANGRVAFLAVAVGEESFTDTNGNGVFDAGVDPWPVGSALNVNDRGEPFLDEAQSGVYAPFEYFYDFNKNGLRDPPNGKFDGVLCKDSGGLGLCGTPLTGIGASNLTILSGSFADKLSPVSGTALTIPLGGTKVFAFTVADVNNNPMPKGTAVSVQITATGSGVGRLTLIGPVQFTVPATVAPTSFGFTVNNVDGAATGILTLTIKAPSGSTTTATYPISTL